MFHDRRDLGQAALFASDCEHLHAEDALDFHAMRLPAQAQRFSGKGLRRRESAVEDSKHGSGMPSQPKHVEALAQRPEFFHFVSRSIGSGAIAELN
jgi:hypothetical protein